MAQPAGVLLEADTYVDFWKAYDAIFYAKTLHHVGKESGETNHIERFNNTFRQRVSRLVRKTLSFSKKLDNHLGASWTFIHHHNASLLLWDYHLTAPGFLAANS